MAFLPNSTIYLCNVPFDSTQKNQVYFTSQEQQREYFITHQVDLLISYNIVRKTLANGSMQSSIRVANRIDDLRAKGVNYLCYQNAQHGAKWFYCFVEQLVYVSENCTEIIFETDVYQTWFFDVNFRESFVVREHSATDNIGDNIVPESFNFNEFKYAKLNNIADGNLLSGGTMSGGDALDEYCYLVCSTESWIDNSSDTYYCSEICGQPNGYYFAVCESVSGLNALMKGMNSENSSDWLQAIIAIPKFNVKYAEITDISTDTIYKDPDDPDNFIDGQLLNKSALATGSVQARFVPGCISFEGFYPKNNKLYTQPYFSLAVTNRNGSEKEYALENFAGYSEGALLDSGIPIHFELLGDISVNPSVWLVPLDYMGVSENFDYAMVLNEFPQMSANCDSFKLYLARNQGNLELQGLSSAIGLIGGIGSMATGVGAGAGLAAIAGGAIGIADTINSVAQAKRTPDTVKGGGGKNNLLVATGNNKFFYYWKMIRKDYAKTVDDYFTMFGYQVNQVKQPNFNTRTRFNYIQTIDINIDGNIPCEDMKALKAIFNNGVTLWGPNEIIGDYTSADNVCERRS